MAWDQKSSRMRLRMLKIAHAVSAKIWLVDSKKNTAMVQDPDLRKSLPCLHSPKMFRKHLYSLEITYMVLKSFFPTKWEPETIGSFLERLHRSCKAKGLSKLLWNGWQIHGFWSRSKLLNQDDCTALWETGIFIYWLIQVIQWKSFRQIPPQSKVPFHEPFLKTALVAQHSTH